LCIVDVHAATEEGAEHVAEPLAHGAVDEEVQWKCNRDAKVNEHCGRVACHVAEQIDVERVLDDNEQQQHRQRHFDEDLVVRLVFRSLS